MALILRELVADPNREHYVLDLMRQASLSSGRVYPVLASMERAGWLESRRESIDPIGEGRPARRLYRLSPDGFASVRRQAATALAADRSALSSVGVAALGKRS